MIPLQVNGFKNISPDSPNLQEISMPIRSMDTRSLTDVFNDSGYLVKLEVARSIYKEGRIPSISSLELSPGLSV